MSLSSTYQFDFSLLPCPFCGGKAMLGVDSYSFCSKITCEKCGCQMVSPYRDDATLLVNEWNKRIN